MVPRDIAAHTSRPDIVKVRLQTQSGGSLSSVTKDILFKEGPLAFYKVDKLSPRRSQHFTNPECRARYYLY